MASATLTGPLALGRNATIGPHAQLVGPSIVGHRATIGAGASVIRTVVLPGGSITDGTLTANAVIGRPEAVLPPLLDHR